MSTDHVDAGSKACSYTNYEDGEAREAYPKTGEGATGTEKRVWDALYEVEDPEMPVSVVDLGLIYGVDVESAAGDEEGDEERTARETATVEMTLTYSGCPAREMLLNDVRCAALAAGVDDATVELRYSPNWNVSMVTERGKEALREFGLSV